MARFVTDFPDRPFPILEPDAFRGELAYLDGPPLVPKGHRKTLFPMITKEDIFEIFLSLKSEPELVVEKFQEAYKDYVGANYAIATASGTASLHLALVGAGVQPGDEVIVPAFTFIATAQAVVAAKAIPIFVDIDPLTFCMDPAAVEDAITPQTTAVMPVHVHGLPADMQKLDIICKKHQLSLVEDASHAHSASIRDQICGSIGDAAGQSLMADKNFPVGGEGGIAFFKQQESYERALRFLEKSGIDYRMSWLAATFGLSQLRRLPYYDEIRERNSRILSKAIDQTELFSSPHVPLDTKHSFNMYRLGIRKNHPDIQDLEIFKVKGAIQDLLLAEGVPAREWQNLPIPMHLPFQTRVGFGRGFPFSLSNREDFGYRIENFPRVLEMLESTLVLCRELRSPIEYEKILAYTQAFQKVSRRTDVIRDLVKENDYVAPYRRDARLG